MPVIVSCDKCYRKIGDLSIAKCPSCYAIPEYKYLKTYPYVSLITNAQDMGLRKCSRCNKLAEKEWFELQKHNLLWDYAKVCCVCRSDFHTISEEIQNNVRSTLYSMNLRRLKYRRIRKRQLCICGAEVISLELHQQTSLHAKRVNELAELFEWYQSMYDESV